jgi:hypothetical protein
MNNPECVRCEPGMRCEGLCLGAQAVKLTINEDGVDHAYQCANGFVQRVVSAVHDVNFADARKLARILNQYYSASSTLSRPNRGDGND